MSTPEPAPPAEQPPTEQRRPVPAEPVPPPDESSSLLAALLIVYAAYLLWRGSHDAVPRSWKLLVVSLGLRELIGAQLAMVASRALGRQRADAGRAGDELWQHVEAAIAAGVDAGLQAVAEALIWTDEQVPDGQDPVTKDAHPTEGTPLVPTMAEPPELLAEMTALATINAAVFTAARAAGWDAKKWNSRRDDRVRDTHRVLNGQVVLMQEVFVSPSGAKLRYPGDPKAPMAEKGGCRCWLTTARR